MQVPIAGRLAAIASLLSLVLAPSAAQAQEKGVLWETSYQSEIPGTPMKIPPVTRQYCAKENRSEAPPYGDPSQCKKTNFKRTANKLTWSVVCENPPMTGEGKLNFSGTDAYTGMILLKTAAGSIHVSLTGKKIGTCDNPQ